MPTYKITTADGTEYKISGAENFAAAEAAAREQGIYAHPTEAEGTDWWRVGASTGGGVAGSVLGGILGIPGGPAGVGIGAALGGGAGSTIGGAVQDMLSGDEVTGENLVTDMVTGSIPGAVFTRPLKTISKIKAINKVLAEAKIPAALTKTGLGRFAQRLAHETPEEVGERIANERFGMSLDSVVNAFKSPNGLDPFDLPDADASTIIGLSILRGELPDEVVEIVAKNGVKGLREVLSPTNTALAGTGLLLTGNPGAAASVVAGSNLLRHISTSPRMAGAIDEGAAAFTPIRGTVAEIGTHLAKPTYENMVETPATMDSLDQLMRDLDIGKTHSYY